MTGKDILYGIKKVVLTELDPTTQLPLVSNPIICNVSTGEEAELEPVLSNGEEKVLRDDNLILAIARTDDLLYGYNLKFKDNVFDPNVASLIEGGTLRKSGQDVVGYDSPMMSSGVTMKPFRAEIYVANMEGDSIKNYVKITLNNCKGKAPKLSLKKDFFAPEFEIRAREATKAGLPVKKIDYVDVLPSDDTTVPVLTMVSVGAITKPAPIIAKSNEIGALYAVLGSLTITTMAHINAAMALGVAAYANCPTADTNTNIPTTGLAAGSYKTYAVDAAGNVSAAGAAITLS